MYTAGSLGGKSMMENPIIEEIHKIREAHARKFNYDMDAIFADLEQKQAKRKNLSTLQPVEPKLRRVAESHDAYQVDHPEKP